MVAIAHSSSRVDERLVATPGALPGGTGRGAPARRSPLRRLLVGLDVAAATSGWAFALARHDPGRSGTDRFAVLVLSVVVATSVTLACIALQRLYRSRVCAVRSVETARLGRAAAAAAAALWLGSGAVSSEIPAGTAFGGSLLAFVLLVAARAYYRARVTAERARGLHARPVVVIGTNDEGLSLCRLIAGNPELGMAVVGVIGDPAGAIRHQFDVPWLGGVDLAVEALRGSGAGGALVAASALEPVVLNRVVRDLLELGAHVHLSSGVRGIDHRRLRSQPLAHEPLFYVEPMVLSPWQSGVKRAIDLVLGGLGLVFALPILAAAAVAIKLHDGGPILFRQERVGRDERRFTILKLRTMVVDAEERLASLSGNNQRDGVLFKLASDPRVTPVGRLLRAASLDELPQLVNVLRGEMSLVGPRPPLASEVAQFDEALLARQRVRPGITGLWQVEARDNPSFEAYQRLDLFYVENWSVGLDLAIMAGTARAVAARGLRILRRAGNAPDGKGIVPAAVLLD